MEVGAIPKTITLSSTIPIPIPSRKTFPERIPNPIIFLSKHHIFSPLSSSFPVHSSPHKTIKHKPHFSPKASFSSSVASAEYVEEPATNVKFQKSLRLPGLSSSLSLLGTGYREKVFAIIGVKVYAAGLYVNQSIFGDLNAWKGRSTSENQADSSLFESIFQVPLEKSLQIVLVRDVDGKTFWDALDEAVSPRIKAPTLVDESALSTFRGIFLGRALKKGTFIFLTWLNPAKMIGTLRCIFRRCSCFSFSQSFSCLWHNDNTQLDATTTCFNYLNCIHVPRFQFLHIFCSPLESPKASFNFV